MIVFRRILSYVLLLLLANIALFINLFELGMLINIIVMALLTVSFIVFNIAPMGRKPADKLSVLMGGYELLISTVVVLITQICVTPVVYLHVKPNSGLPELIINTLVSLVLVIILMWNGLIRIMLTSKQLSITTRTMIFFTWWIPVINLLVFIKCCSVIRKEYIFEITKSELNFSRKENEICKTRYPILLVHGIFWRDWQLFNYWGRIPRELSRNGATVYYGNHQSAGTMEDGANELKNQILNIIAKENCEKVNIIAHSKGGLDTRYAISCLGMDAYVASLTTVASPHLGSCLADKLLNTVPKGLLQFIAERYNAAYKKLGDRKPDFISGVYDLTTEKCTAFNEKVQNKEGVLYQSVVSKMSTAAGAAFPLNLGYALIRRIDKDNDGFITVESSIWGDFLRCYSSKNKRGISHGDTIDLTRKNIRGFDVCECYVELVSGLKAKNL